MSEAVMVCAKCGSSVAAGKRFKDSKGRVLRAVRGGASGAGRGKAWDAPERKRFRTTAVSTAHSAPRHRR